MACGGASPNLLAASLARNDVNDCVQAAIDGDIITVPAGNVTWPSRIDIANKSISIIGAGKGLSIVSTTGGNGGISWQCKPTGHSPAGLTRLSGFTFTGTGCKPGKIPTLLDFFGDTPNLLVDDVRVETVSGGCYGLQTRGFVRGVGYRNQYVNTGCVGCHVVHSVHDQWNNVSGGVTSGLPCCGDASWADDPTMGTADNMFHEDCEFINSAADPTNCWYHTDDLGGGGRVVVRFSTFDNAILAVHGTESGGRQRGFRHWEVYRNRFDWDATVSPWPGVFGLRGGTGHLFDNAAFGPLQYLFGGNVYRRSGTVIQPYPWGRCGTVSINAISRVGTLATARHNSNPWDPDPPHATGGSYLEILGANEANFNGVKKVITHTVSIVDSTAANPTTVTTSVAHGFQTGDRVKIRSHSFSGLNTSEFTAVTITVTGPTTFTVPLLGGGSGGTVSNNNMFSYRVADSGALSASGTLSFRSPFDGNTNGTGYPCMDGLGRGKGIMISGTEPNGLDSDYAAPNPNPPQAAGNALEPVYCWNNLDDGVLSPFNDTGGDVTTENVDYYNQNNSFNGTTQHGIGRGLRSARPASCATGDAWWATDGGGNWNTSTTEPRSAEAGLTSGADGGLDLCTAPNTWQNDWYVPYTYPHPLVTAVIGGGGGGGGGGGQGQAGILRLKY